MTDPAQSIFYTFLGRVHPERCAVSFSDFSVEMRAADGSTVANLRCNVSHSQVAVTVTAQNPIDDVYTLRNSVEDCVRTALDAYGFSVGCGYDVEISQLVDSVGSDPILFGVGIPDVGNAARDAGVTFDMIVRLYANPRGEYLQRCLANLREAIRVPIDTGFFCYRGVEALRQFFVVERGAQGDSASWEALRSELIVGRSDIDAIKPFADSTRHGGRGAITDTERSFVVQTAWRIANLFILYADRGYTKVQVGGEASARPSPSDR